MKDGEFSPSPYERTPAGGDEFFETTIYGNSTRRVTFKRDTVSAIYEIDVPATGRTDLHGRALRTNIETKGGGDGFTVNADYLAITRWWRGQ